MDCLAFFLLTLQLIVKTCYIGTFPGTLNFSYYGENTYSYQAKRYPARHYG